MKRVETRLEGPVLLEPTGHGDERGFFAETYQRRVFEALGIHGEFVQDNHSRSRRGIVRGMQGYELNDTNLRIVYVPFGFAHGFCVLSESADVIYKQDGYYDPAQEQGIRFDDPDVGIEWPQGLELTPSQRDATAPLLREIANDLPFVYR